MIIRSENNKRSDLLSFDTIFTRFDSQFMYHSTKNLILIKTVQMICELKSNLDYEKFRIPFTRHPIKVILRLREQLMETMVFRKLGMIFSE